MNKSAQLDNFFRSIQDDGRISITHIGVYTALLQYWQQNCFAVPLFAFSRQVQEIAKVSRLTYQKCVRDLNEYGYLKYVPSFKRNRASEIYLTNINST
ncbi:hypothetical protein SAMN06297358_2621 [Pedobacter xixiisoli]|uniref:Helix-turn-helix domain-containing protein n=1 Tax=Pedobacter xixiisoli TaxID=1476464 RepID=A0A286A6Z6_9SPHI|nr:hypothetical protein SAMN06297358_2621 [Pedobacter xixiisoli]